MNALIYLASAVLCGVFAARGWAGDRKDRTRRAFVVVGAVAMLTFGSFGLYLLTGNHAFRYVHASLGAFLPVAILWFLDRLLGRGGLRGLDGADAPWVDRLWPIALGVVGLFLLSELVFFGFARATSPGEFALAVFVQVGFLAAFWRMWQAHERSTQVVEKGRLRYLLGLLAAAAVFSAGEQLLRFIGMAELTPDVLDWGLLDRSVFLQGALPPVGVVLATLFLFFLEQIVRLSRLLDLHEIFARLFSLATASMLLVGIESLTVIQAEALVGYETHGIFQVFLASAIFLSVYQSVQRRIEHLAGEWFNRPGRRLELTLQEVDKALSRVISLNALEAEVLGRLYASGRAPLVSLYLWDQKRSSFVLKLYQGLEEQPLRQSIASSPYADRFRQGTPAYVRANLERIVRRRDAGFEDALACLQTMDAMHADLSICLYSGDLVLGWLNLKAEAWMDGFSKDEVRRLCETVSRLAVLIENLYSVEDVKEQHRLAALGTMAAGLAHEIRNPLAGIKGAAQYLQEVADEAPPEEVVDFAGVITSEVDRLSAVVTQFLDYARPLAIRAEPTDLPRLVERSLALVQRQPLPEGVRLEANVGAAIPEVPMDPDKIHQVLLNLVQNALQAVGDAGHVQVELGLGRIRRRGAVPTTTDAVELRVRDDGPGIDAENLEKLFIPFFTTRMDGTGLGLAISRRLVEAHGGELQVKSALGGGSTFVVRLPLGVPPDAPEVDERPEGSSADATA